MAAGEPHHEVVRVVVVVGVADQADGGVEQERAEDVEHPGELVDRHRAERDEDAAEDQRQDDADQERLLLILLGHVEAGHDDQEDEQVVDRQAVLGEPAGEELDTELAAVEEDTPRLRRRPRARCRSTAPSPSSRFEGSCGRRPMTTTSNSRTAIVTASVMIHSSCETCMYGSSGRRNARGLFHQYFGPRAGRPMTADVMTTPRRRNTPLSTQSGRPPCPTPTRGSR